MGLGPSKVAKLKEEIKEMRQDIQKLTDAVIASNAAIAVLNKQQKEQVPHKVSNSQFHILLFEI